MTAAGVVSVLYKRDPSVLTVLQIMAQLGMFVPARKARYECACQKGNILSY